MALDAEIGGDIVESQKAEGGIYDEPDQGGGGALQLALENVVEENNRRAQVIQGVVDPVLEDFGVASR